MSLERYNISLHHAYQTNMYFRIDENKLLSTYEQENMNNSHRNVIKHISINLVTVRTSNTVEYVRDNSQS